jgi:predicted nucleic acid-binding protein
LSAITIAEITYLVEKRRLTAQQLADLLAVVHRPDTGFVVVAFDLAVAETLSHISRDLVPDLPDRMIAATALHLQLPLVTKDARIQSTQVSTVW